MYRDRVGDVGFACTQIELLPALIYPSGQKRVITFPHNGGSFQGNWERFQSHIASSRGVIAGTGKRHGHALAFEFSTVLDPDGRPFHFTQGACETRHFYCQMLWRLDRINPLTNDASPREANDRLYARVAKGDKAARTKMIVANMPLVTFKVSSYLQVFQNLEYLREDIIGEANLALVEAVDKMSAGDVGSPTGYMSVSIQKAIEGTLSTAPPPPHIRHGAAPAR